MQIKYDNNDKLEVDSVQILYFNYNCNIMKTDVAVEKGSVCLTIHKHDRFGSRLIYVTMETRTSYR